MRKINTVLFVIGMLVGQALWSVRDTASVVVLLICVLLLWLRAI